MPEAAARSLRRRVFARVLSFDLECPHCGTIDCVRATSRLPWLNASPRFHIVRSRWRCRACRRVYAVGLALWPVRRAGNRPRGDRRPLDTRPSLTQIMQMRQVLGLVRGQSRGWHDEVNLICICGADEDSEHTPDCPLADANMW